MLTDNFTPKNSYTHLVTKKSMGIISQCPHHKKCYAPFCPLDIYQDQVRPLFYMKEFHKCKFQKRRRKEIAKDYKELKYDGLNPDEWEKIALIEFNEGKTAAKKQFFKPGTTQPFYRYMAPLPVEESCLACHVEQQYKPGDIIGGISTIINHNHTPDYLYYILTG